MANEQQTQTITQQQQTVNPVVNTEQVTTGTEQVVERTPVSLKDEDLVEVIVDGKVEVLPYKEAKSGWMRQADYTRKTQTTASKARELQELYEAVTERQGKVAEKEAAIDAILGRTTPQTKANGLPDDEVLTFGQLKEILNDFKGQVSKDYTSKLAEQSEQTEQARTWERWENMTNETVGALAKEFPVLKTIPHLSSVLKKEAKRENPASEEDMVKSILRAGKKMAEDLDGHYAEQRKAEVVRKRNLETKGPEPKGGSPSFQSKKTYGKNRSIDWNELESDVIAAIESED